MSDLPTLHDISKDPRISGVNFWCVNRACLHRDLADAGRLTIDWGSSTTLPDLAAVSFCLECYGQVQVLPSWGEGGHNPFTNFGGKNAADRRRGQRT